MSRLPLSNDKARQDDARCSSDQPELLLPPALKSGANHADQDLHPALVGVASELRQLAELVPDGCPDINELLVSIADAIGSNDSLMNATSVGGIQLTFSQSVEDRQNKQALVSQEILSDIVSRLELARMDTEELPCSSAAVFCERCALLSKDLQDIARANKSATQHGLKHLFDTLVDFAKFNSSRQDRFLNSASFTA